MFNTAYFLRVSPAEVMALPLSEFALWHRQAQRISEQLRGGEHG